MTSAQQTPDSFALWQRFNWWFWGSIGVLIVLLSAITIFLISFNSNELAAAWINKLIAPLFFVFFVLEMTIILTVFIHKFTKNVFATIATLIIFPVISFLLFFRFDISVTLLPLTFIALLPLLFFYFIFYLINKKMTRTNAQIPNPPTR